MKRLGLLSLRPAPDGAPLYFLSDPSPIFSEEGPLFGYLSSVGGLLSCVEDGEEEEEAGPPPERTFFED